jgi:hypothetical protein
MLLSQETERLGFPPISVTKDDEGRRVVLHPAEGAYFSLVPVDPDMPDGEQKMEPYDGPVPPVEDLDNPPVTGLPKSRL